MKTFFVVMALLSTTALSQTVVDCSTVETSCIANGLSNCNQNFAFCGAKQASCNACQKAQNECIASNMAKDLCTSQRIACDNATEMSFPPQANLCVSSLTSASAQYPVTTGVTITPIGPEPPVSITTPCSSASSSVIVTPIGPEPVTTITTSCPTSGSSSIIVTPITPIPVTPAPTSTTLSVVITPIGPEPPSSVSSSAGAASPSSSIVAAGGNVIGYSSVAAALAFVAAFL